jgi:predicted RNase H-like HicB family nuclease
MNRIIHAHIRRGERLFVAECHEIAVVTQGETLDEAVENLREATALHLDGEDLAALGLEPDPLLSVTIDFPVNARNAA